MRLLWTAALTAALSLTGCVHHRHHPHAGGQPCAGPHAEAEGKGCALHGAKNAEAQEQAGKGMPEGHAGCAMGEGKAGGHCAKCDSRGAASAAGGDATPGERGGHGCGMDGHAGGKGAPARHEGHAGGSAPCAKCDSHRAASPAAAAADATPGKMGGHGSGMGGHAGAMGGQAGHEGHAGQGPMGHQHRFEDAQKWAAVFDDPARDAWQKPEEVIKALELAPDAKVADLGAGTGYFAVRLARAVPKGKVYGADVEQDMVRYLNERAKKETLPNLSGVLAGMEDPKLPEAVDLVLVVDTYHHISDRVAYFERLKKSLRPGGRLAIIDFTKEAPMGPPPEARLTPEQVGSELKQAGFELAKTLSLLPNQYFLVYRAAH